MYACHQQEETLLSAERGQPLGENQLESAGGGIYSPAGHYFADDNDHVRQFLNDSVITSTDTALLVEEINFVDTTHYSYAIVRVSMSGASPNREVFLLFRANEHIQVTLDSSKVIITDTTPPGVSGGINSGIQHSTEAHIPACINRFACDYIGESCRYNGYDRKRDEVWCSCPPESSGGGSLTILVGRGCGLDHDGDGNPG